MLLLTFRQASKQILARVTYTESLTFVFEKSKLFYFKNLSHEGSQATENEGVRTLLNKKESSRLRNLFHGVAQTRLEGLD